MQGSQVPSLIRELDPSCCKEQFACCNQDRRSRGLQQRPGAPNLFIYFLQKQWHLSLKDEQKSRRGDGTLSTSLLRKGTTGHGVFAPTSPHSPTPSFSWEEVKEHWVISGGDSFLQPSSPLGRPRPRWPFLGRQSPVGEYGLWAFLTMKQTILNTMHTKNCLEKNRV